MTNYNIEAIYGPVAPSASLTDEEVAEIMGDDDTDDEEE